MDGLNETSQRHEDIGPSNNRCLHDQYRCSNAAARRVADMAPETRMKEETLERVAVRHVAPGWRRRQMHRRRCQLSDNHVSHSLSGWNLRRARE